MERFAVWRDWDGPRIEAAGVTLSEIGLTAVGTQIGADPLPYRLDYELDAGDGWITRSLRIEARGEGWSRRLRLSRSHDGAWSADADAQGAIELPEPGGTVAGLERALDCDLGYSPLTNVMPVRRERLDERPGERDFVMAWVAVPGLTVQASAQRYEHVSADARGAVVRFLDRGLFDGFEVELEYDADGLVRVYPELARRL